MKIDQDQFLEADQRRALCVACGADKMEPFERCEHCRFEPKDEDLVKSIYLSVYRYFDSVSLAEPYSRELTTAQNSLREGKVFEFDSGELTRISGFVEKLAIRDQTTAPLLVALFQTLAATILLNWRKMLVFVIIGVTLLFLIKSVG